MVGNSGLSVVNVAKRWKEEASRGISTSANWSRAKNVPVDWTVKSNSRSQRKKKLTNEMEKICRLSRFAL